MSEWGKKNVKKLPQQLKFRKLSSAVSMKKRTKGATYRLLEDVPQ